MTTLTSRSLPLIPLQLNIGTGDSLMHPDNRMLHNRVLPLDRLSPKEERLSPQSRYGSETSLRNSICDIDRIDGRKIIGTDDMSDARSSSVSSYMADSFNKEHDDDQMSYCSDESELSVGKEVESERQFNGDKIDPLTERTNLCGIEEMSNESLRYSSKVPNIVRPSPTRLQEEFLRKSQLYAEELMKHQMSFMAATRGLNISPNVNDHTFGYPVRPDALSPIRSPDESRVGFRPHIRSNEVEKKWTIMDDRNSMSPEGSQFRGIHSHLNAISKITSALGRDMANLTSPGSITSRDSSQSPPNNLHQILNNNINDSNLKFSIDNILKPGFGRRITDPLLKRNKTKRKNVQRSTVASEKHGTPIDLTATMTTTTTTGANDDTSTPSSAASAGIEQDKVTSTSNSKTDSSGGPMVWPAWVYCTRYSDRPSSGK